MFIFTCVAYVMYMLCVMFWLSRIYGIAMAKIQNVILVIILNSFLIYTPFFSFNFIHEELFMIVFFLVLGVEVQLIYKQPFMTTLSSILCFIINFFGLKVLVIGIFSLYRQQDIIDILSVIDNKILITAIVFIIVTPYILISSKILISNTVIYIFKDKTTLTLACVLLSAIAITQLLTIPTLYIGTGDWHFNAIYQIRTGLLALISFVIVMLIVFIYSNLKKASKTYEDTSAEIESENVTIKRLNEEAKTDFCTGFYVKKIAMDVLQKSIGKKEYCYVVYLDLDGLKIVNDTYGHEEGDWYIKNATKCIKESFSYDIIARIGGDEFLVIGNKIRQLDVMQSAQDCHEAVVRLKEKHKKEYDTSISYGVVVIDKTNKLSIDSLIDLADSRMYEFKKGRNKERKG